MYLKVEEPFLKALKVIWEFAKADQVAPVESSKTPPEAMVEG